MTRTLRWAIPGILLLVPAAFVIAQPPEGFRGPGGPSGPGGPRGFGPPGSGEDRKLVEKFDQDENGWLDQKERVPARAEAKSEGERRGGFGPPGGRRGRGGNRPAPQPGPKVSPSDVATNTKAGLYDANVVRTLFFEFENEDWEKELEDFHGTDVDVPATLTVDGKTYENVGMRFRGMSSYGMVPTGYKRSFNVSIDMADDDQRLYGYKTLNLLNCAGDASFMSTVLYSKIASDYIPVPKANHVQVVINGESWGVYANVQQYDKTFISEHFDPSKGTRWKVSGSPAGDGGLRYMGEELEPYKARYDMKSNDGNKAWKALVDLCRTLNETPLDQLEKELEPMLDIDEALKFLAIDVALVNSDGYWTRASDYYLFLDHEKRFHLIPHDMNEAFQGGRGGSRGPGGPPPGMGDRGPRDRGRGEGDRDERDRPRFDPRERGPDDGERAERGPRPEGEGPGGFFPGFFGPPPGAEGERGQGPGGPRRGPGGIGGPGGPGHGGADLDPLVSIDNPRMALRNKLLAIPSLRAKYLGYVREIAEKSLAPEKIDAIVQQHAKQIEAIVASDTRKLESTEAFLQTTSMDANAKADAASLRKFCEERRDYLLNYQDPQASKR